MLEDKKKEEECKAITKARRKKGAWFRDKLFFGGYALAES